MTSAAKEHPVVAVLCCGGGGGLMAAKGLVTVRGATGHDKRALECDRVGCTKEFNWYERNRGGEIADGSCAI